MTAYGLSRQDPQLPATPNGLQDFARHEMLQTTDARWGKDYALDVLVVSLREYIFKTNYT